MATTLESVDNLAKPPPHDRVNPSERSSAEHQRRQFKKALKEEMERQDGEESDHEQVDALILGKDGDAPQECESDETEAERGQPGAHEIPSKKPKETSSEAHIDLKA